MEDAQAVQAVQESWRRLVPVAQHVSAVYRIEDGFLVESGDMVTAYAPMAQPELPGELAKVRSAADAEAFARRYGLLGFDMADRTLPEGLAEHVVALGREDVLQEIMRDRKEYRRRLKEAGPEPRDPVEWVLAHAATVRVILELAHLLQDGDEAALSRYLDQYRAQRASGEEVFLLRVARGGDFPPGLAEYYPGGGVPATCRRIAAELINENLRGARRRVDRETLQSYFGLYTLIGCIYWLLADGIGRKQLRQCLACGAIFTATDDRMKYCPPPMGLSGASRCMNRAKQRKLRAARQEQARRTRKKKTRRPRR